MLRILCSSLLVALLVGQASAQDYYHGGGGYYGGDYYGAASVGSSEPLFAYDDLEPWKHGYIQVMPFYGGFHFYRPYNYKQVFAQSQTSAGWGMPNTMPYSQQFWHRYEQQADLSLPRVPQQPLYQAPSYQPIPAPTSQPLYPPQTDAGSQQWYMPVGVAPPSQTAVPAGFNGASAAPRRLMATPSEQARAMRDYLEGPALP
jgi:hypothetical protein